MHIPNRRTALLFAAACLGATHLSATPAVKTGGAWCRFQNDSGETYIITNDDGTKYTSVGSLWVRQPGDPGYGKNVKAKGDSAIIAPGLNEIYFDTTAKQYAVHYKLQSQRSNKTIHIHVTNIDPTEPKGTQIRITADPLSGSNLVVDYSGYRNSAGGTLFTLKGPGGSQGSDTD